MGNTDSKNEPNQNEARAETEPDLRQSSIFCCS